MPKYYVNYVMVVNKIVCVEANSEENACYEAEQIENDIASGYEYTYPLCEVGEEAWIHHHIDFIKASKRCPFPDMDSILSTYYNDDNPMTKVIKERLAKEEGGLS